MSKQDNGGLISLPNENVVPHVDIDEGCQIILSTSKVIFVIEFFTSC
jgi:hypothetical protein